MESTTVEAGERTESAALREGSVPAAFQVTAAANPDRVAIRTKGDEVSLTWADYADRVKAAAAGLAGLGVKRGDPVAIMLLNRPEFHVLDAAAMHLGAIPFSVYNTYSAEQVEHLVTDASSRVLVTERAFLDRVLEVRDSVEGAEHVIVVDGEGGGAEGPGTLSLGELSGRADPGFDFDAAWRAVEADDVLTLIYTSGTTGPPKGVEITHGGVIAAARSFDQMIRFPVGARVVSYLPMAHIAERMCSQYLPIMFAFATTCCPDPRQVIAYLPEVRPNWFFAVPRIWEKAKAALEAGFAAEADEQRRQATSWALDVGLRRVRAEQAGEEVSDELAAEYEKADAMVLSKVRERLGLDEAQAVNVGAAPTPPEVIEFFHALGIPLGEIWGMSETCGAGTCNRPERVKIGSVGPPSPDVEVRLADDGEVLVRSPVVMRGYRNQPDKTAETIDSDGWLHTGDVGEFDDEGFLKIVDRKKELIINSAGKNMSPANIEAKAKASSPLIGQVMAIGDRRPYVTALVTLDPDVAPGFAERKGVADSSLETLAEEEAVAEEVQRGIDTANESLARVEQIKRFRVLPVDWEPGGDELTPTMKLKRKPISEKYADEIEALYAE
jgi:long-subunit acyl-CoA synthetase (AMP-forming)